MRTPETNKDAGECRHGNSCLDCTWVQHRDDGPPMLPGFEDIPNDPLPRERRPPRRRRPPAPEPDSEPLFEIEEPNTGEVA